MRPALGVDQLGVAPGIGAVGRVAIRQERAGEGAEEALYLLMSTRGRVVEHEATPANKLTDEAVRISREWVSSLLNQVHSSVISESCYGINAPDNEDIKIRAQVLSALSLWSVYSRVVYSAEKRQWRNTTIDELRDDELRQPQYREYLAQDLLVVLGLLSGIDHGRGLAEEHRENQRIQNFERDALARFACGERLTAEAADLRYVSNLISALLQVKFANGPRSDPECRFSSNTASGTSSG